MVGQIFHEGFILVAAVALLIFATRIVLGMLRAFRRPIPKDNLVPFKVAVIMGTAMGTSLSIAGFLVIFYLVCK